ncbi:MAG: N-6 DNA methylase [Polyangiaceae bacterium]|nr:N-6 DNA methylase [Polyangiaceae bacterium]
MKDRDVAFHREWLGLAQPIEGLVFSVPVLADAQIAPAVRPELSVAFEAALDDGRLPPLARFFADFLGYDRPGMLVPRAELPAALSFYAPEGGQELRPSFALARSPLAPTGASSADPFAEFDAPPEPLATSGASAPAPIPSPNPGPSPSPSPAPSPYFALAWDLRDDAPPATALELDSPEDKTGPWRYPPTAKLERLLRHAGIPIGLITNGTDLRLLHAPAGQTTGHLTFRLDVLREPGGRPVLAALELLLHARRAYGAAAAHSLEGLLAESRRRQADVTQALADQVFEAVELLLAGFEQAALRDSVGDRVDWLRAALEEPGDHLYQGVLGVVLRLVFLLYSEDAGLMPTEDPHYSEHLSLFGLHARLTHDAGAHPESMHHRFGAYGQLLTLFRAVFLGGKHGKLELPPRRGQLFDPNAFPFLEGGLPGWTAAVASPEARAKVQPPSLDDGTVHRVLDRLVVFEGQRLSYRALDVEQIGSVYESLMGYHVERLASPAARIGKNWVWVDTGTARSLSPTDRARLFKEVCGLNPGPIAALEAALKAAGKDDEAALEALLAQAPGKQADRAQHRAPAGRLVIQPGEERRRSGSHYTPRSLTEPIVKRTLEPLLACLGPDRTAAELLQLKICDPAMGSGAFLVAACRELASELVAAWTRSGELAALVEAHGDAHLHARRLVAQQCLYGVDKNPAAVELAKLALWLVTLSKTLPFTFVDHALRQGDSLVGLSFDQLRRFHWEPEARAGDQVDVCESLLTEALEQAVDLRQQILALAEHDDPVSQGEKARLLEFAQQAIGRVRLVGDLVVGAFFAEKSAKAREAERVRRLDLVRQWLGAERALAAVDREGAAAPASKLERQQLAALRESLPALRDELEELAHEARERLTPFHWWLEYPEVFFEERPDPLQGGLVNGAALMEAVVGNPPFLKGLEVSGVLGEAYRDWLPTVHAGAHGNSDLSAHFFRRAATLLGEHGTFGLIATNTIAQGDTRTTGLQPLVEQGWELYDAIDSMPWPAPGVAVTVSVVHAAHGAVCGKVVKRWNRAAVKALTSRLTPGAEREDAHDLRANVATAFVGSYVLGLAFTLTAEERAALVQRDRCNGERTFPYLNGEEVNTSPTQEFSRYVISFGKMELAESERWPDLLRIVREKVKPEREKNNREARRKHWWRFAEPAAGLYSALGPLDRCLVTALSGKHRAFAWQPAQRVFDQTLIVFPLQHDTQFAILQSRVHEIWAVLLSATIKKDQRYNPSRCVSTFPFPAPEPRTVLPALEAAGEALYQARARFMVATDQGLTKTYNALKDPACTDARVLELRALHEAMDRAVLAAYGWSDLPVPPYCPATDADRAALKSFTDEVIDRLYALNAERAAAEAASTPTATTAVAKRRGQSTSGTKDPTKKGAAKAKPGRGKKGGGQGSLF